MFSADNISEIDILGVDGVLMQVAELVQKLEGYFSQKGCGKPLMEEW